MAQKIYFYFLADHTKSRTIGTVFRPSVAVCRLYGIYCG